MGEGRKPVRVRGSRWLPPSSVSQTDQGGCEHGLSAAVRAGTRPAQAQARQNPSVERGGGHEARPTLS